MTIRRTISIRVPATRAAEFATAFAAVRAPTLPRADRVAMPHGDNEIKDLPASGTGQSSALSGSLIASDGVAEHRG
ncbi:hypothetical protein [Nocardia sp. CDC160]|uniref:hypothetical protein n=1 Tax=Nocardia sp. CDC160 TaxID=3112166 RepID=UPI002DBA44AC|nr:hypothetical protein [Nocardia sp. CDC160]MEC3918653.1 hypothetical protein [Nocardia sp. CDC160]